MIVAVISVILILLMIGFIGFCITVTALESEEIKKEEKKKDYYGRLK